MIVYYIYLVLWLYCMKSYFPESWISQDFFLFLQTYKPYYEGLKFMWHPPPPPPLKNAAFYNVLLPESEPEQLSNTWTFVRLTILFPFPLWRPIYVWTTSKSVRMALVMGATQCCSLFNKARVLVDCKLSSFACPLLILYSVSTFTQFIKLFAIKWPLVIPLAYNEKQRIIGSFSYLKKKKKVADKPSWREQLC